MATVYLTYAYNPADPLLSSLREERNEVGRSLDPCQKDGRIILRQEDNTQLNEVITGLDRHSADMIIFGFSGHAGKTTLSFTDKDANGAAIAHMLRKEACPHLKLVLLNGCATVGQVAALEEAGVPIIIATSASVEDKTAKHFAVSFFHNLAVGKTVRFAFEQAKIAISGEAGKKDPFIIRSGENRGMVLREAKDKPEPAWMFSCREERFGEWTLEMGKREPYPLSSLTNNDSLIRLLLVGKKYEKVFDVKLKSQIVGKKLAFYTVELEEFITNQVKIEKELCHTDALIFTVEAIEFEAYWDNENFAYAKKVIKDRYITTIFLKDSCTKDNYMKYSGELGLEKKTFGIPIIPYFDISSLKKNFTDDEVYEILRKEFEDNILRIDKDLIREIECFDLGDQNRFLGEWKPVKKFTLICLEGTVNCGLNLLFKKVLDRLGENVKKSPRFRLNFQSKEGVIDSKETLFSKLYANLSGKSEKEVSSELFFNNFFERLEENPVCLIFDDPFAVEHGAKVLIDFYQELIKRQEAERWSLKPMYLVILNRSWDDAIRFNKLVTVFQESEILNIAIVPPVSRIDLDIYNTWLGEKRWFLQQYVNVQSLDENGTEMLVNPFLEPVIGEICNSINHARLHPLIFQEP